MVKKRANKSELSTEENLKRETEKWLGRIKEEMKKVSPKDDKGKEHLKNIQAYISDSEFFSSQKRYVHAFEAVLWGWAWLSILRDLGKL